MFYIYLHLQFKQKNPYNKNMQRIKLYINLKILQLLKIVKKMIEKEKKQKIFDNLFNMAYQPIIVSKKAMKTTKKQFTTVFNALNNAQQHVIIKINPGIYNQRLQIKYITYKVRKKYIKIQASQISQNTILVNQEFPNIIIDLPSKQDKIYFQGLKLINACQNNTKHEIINGSYQRIKQHQYMNFKTNSCINSCIYIIKGTVQLDQCKISLAAYHNKQSTLPCIVVEKDGCLILNRSEIIGGMGTIGLFSKGGKIIMKQTIFRQHGVAGLLFSTKSNTSILIIKNCNFSKCTEAIVLNGPFQAIMQNNSIRNCLQYGIVIYNGNRSKIINNQINNCHIGLQIKNSFPFILKNNITQCQKLGVLLKSSSGILCKPMLKFNIIKQNCQGGILIQGSLNKANIFNNQLSYNKKFGIKVMNRASPHIFMNKISKTLQNGVQICPNSSVFLQKNEIQQSLKCNLAIEGPNNIDNFIFRNTITKSRGQGILCIFSQKFTIKQNQITQNYNGIVSMTGVQIIQCNQIKGNKKNGILLIKDNNVVITENTIENNKKSGIFIRDSSIGKIQYNYFYKNTTEIVIQNDDVSFSDIQKKNTFQEEYDIRVPRNYYCQLI